MEIIGYIHNAFREKFGIPRQSGLVDEVLSTVTLLPPYNDKHAVRGLEEFSHIWLVWRFDVVSREGDDFTPTVRPPRLGGEERVGVFASRSPFRPNALGLSCVKLVGIEQTKEGPVLTVAGADLRDGTAIYDIKPYVPLADCHPEATGGFTDTRAWVELAVDFPPELAARIPQELLPGLIGSLEQDPRPAYQRTMKRVYQLFYDDFEIAFSVDEAGVLHVEDVKPTK